MDNGETSALNGVFIQYHLLFPHHLYTVTQLIIANLGGARSLTVGRSGPICYLVRAYYVVMGLCP